MKTVLLAVSLLLPASAMANGNHKNDQHERYSQHHVKTVHPQYRKKENRLVRVVSSRQIYKNVTVYRTCPPHADLRFTLGSNSGSTVFQGTFGKPHKREIQCKKSERRLVGYKNVAYWHGRKIVEVSQRPLKWVRVLQNERYAKR